MKRVLFIDRDGTLIIEPPDGQIDSLEKLEFFPGIFTWLGRIASELSYELVLVTNQDGLGTDRFPEDTFWPAHHKLMTALRNEGIRFADEHIDRSLPADQAPTRKPGIAMLTRYLNGDFDLQNSFTVGDRLTDIQLAKNLGCKGILLNTADMLNNDLKPFCSLASSSWKEIYEFLRSQARIATVQRTTKETDIQIVLNLDGKGESQIATGLGFFDHMLEQVARHGSIDLQIKANGDLHIDEHHTIEDTALALGDAFIKALGDKRGIDRYGFLLPMDESLAQVAIDFGGRPWLVWDAEFKREKIGDMPTEMFYHFFKSFSDAARCNLNIKVEGTNEHHKIEAIFKAFAKAINMAIKRNRDTDVLPSTKGLL